MVYGGPQRFFNIPCKRKKIFGNRFSHHLEVLGQYIKCHLLGLAKLRIEVPKPPKPRVLHVNFPLGCISLGVPCLGSLY